MKLKFIDYIKIIISFTFLKPRVLDISDVNDGFRKHTWALDIRWYSPVTWMMVIVFGLCSLFMGGFKGLGKFLLDITEDASYGSHTLESVILEKNRKFKYWMYYY